MKITNSVIKMTWSANGGISKKNLAAYLNMINEILSILHFDRASDGRMAHILGINVKTSALKSFLKEENDRMRKMSGNRAFLFKMADSNRCRMDGFFEE